MSSRVGVKYASQSSVAASNGAPRQRALSVLLYALGTTDSISGIVLTLTPGRFELRSPLISEM